MVTDFCADSCIHNMVSSLEFAEWTNKWVSYSSDFSWALFLLVVLLVSNVLVFFSYL